MITRISTLGQVDSALTQMQTLQSEVAQTQQQIGSGLSFTTAQDNPVAASTAVALNQAQAEYTTYSNNANTVSGRLNQEASTLSNVYNTLSRLQTLAAEANSGTQDATTRATLLPEIAALKQSLLADANTTDGQGGYLFSGTAANTPPFVQQGTQVGYMGNQGQPQVAVAPGTTVADSDPGSEVFMRVRTGNGTVAARAGAGNTGTGVLTSSGFTNQAQWDGGSYTVSFSGGNYQVTDASSNVVASGAYTSGQAIGFRGYQLTLSGQPASGDSFTVAPAPTQDVFTLADNLATALQSNNSPAGNAAQQNQLYAAMEDLSTAADHVSNVQASVGARINAMTTAGSERDGALLGIQTTLSSLQDLDYAAALSHLSIQSTALQASQQTFAKIESLSLFNYVR